MSEYIITATPFYSGKDASRINPFGALALLDAIPTKEVTS